MLISKYTPTPNLAKAAPAQAQPSVPVQDAPAYEPSDSFESNTFGKVATYAGGAVLGGLAGTFLGGGAGFLNGVGGAAVGALGGATIGFFGGFASSKVIKTDPHAVGNVFLGMAAGAVGGLATGVMVAGFGGGLVAQTAMGVLGASAGLAVAHQFAPL